jgi:hypothetical protein
MSSVAVVIPWYEGTQDQHRQAALTYVRSWWAVEHPDWEVVTATMDSGEGPWRKGLAVHRGLQQTDAEMIVVADADVTCDGTADAIEQVRDLRTGWAIPHRLVCRLTEQATVILLQEGRYPPTPTRVGTSAAFAEIYPGTAAGGLVVLPRRLLLDVPIDPRFCGWGQEDMAWSRALTMVAGHPWRGRAPLFHLWHTPQDRVSRGVGSTASLALWQRYQGIATLPAMLDLLVECQDQFGLASAGGLSEPAEVI